jgi:hypothetical protein
MDYTYRIYFKRTLTQQPSILFDHPDLMKATIEADSSIKIYVNNLDTPIEITTNPGIVPMNTWTHLFITESNTENTLRAYLDSTVIAVATIPTVTLLHSYWEYNVTLGFNVGKLAIFEIYYFIQAMLPDIIHW